ncbi:MAG: TRAP transporter substrate-binding protein [Bacillota bacterium]
MNRKKILFLIACILVLTLVFTGCGQKQTEEKGTGAPDQKEQTINLSYGEVNPDGHPITDGAYEFARIVKEKTNGRITITVYPAGQLGSEREHIQSLQAGGLDFFRSNSNTLPDFGSGKMSILALPFIFDNRDHMWKALNGPIGQEVLQDLIDNKMRMIGLTYFDDGARHVFTNNKKIEKVEDLKGLKIRVPQNQIMMDMIEALGASPTPIAYGELYSSLQTGIVDGAENTIAGYLTNSFYEPSPYLTLNAHMSSPGVVIVSELTWNKLSAEDQKIIREAAQEASKFVRLKTEAFEAEALKELAKRGATITYIDDISPWQEAVAPLYNTYGSKYMNLIEAIQNTK